MAKAVPACSTGNKLAVQALPEQCEEGVRSCLVGRVV